MDQFVHSVTLEKRLCNGCTNCIKRCPTEAIRVREGKAGIEAERCIDCGECIRLCPHRAKRAVSDPLALLGHFEYRVAIVPPSLYVQYNHQKNQDMVLDALCRAGFDDVFEEAEASELISDATSRIMATGGAARPVISSACPAVTRLIRVRFPELIDNIVDVKSPMEVAAIEARRRFCAERGASNLVLHTTRRLETPPPNETGAARAFRLAEAAEKYGVNLAWENTRFPDYNAYLYARVPSPRMRFCFDSGHANCFTPGEDPLARFGERMTAMHLHDNHGPRLGDEHLLPGQGEIDFPALMRRLKAYRPEYYHLESRFETDGTETAADMAAYLRDAYSRLRALTQL